MGFFNILPKPSRKLCKYKLWRFSSCFRNLTTHSKCEHQRRHCQAFGQHPTYLRCRNSTWLNRLRVKTVNVKPFGLIRKEWSSPVPLVRKPRTAKWCQKHKFLVVKLTTLFLIACTKAQPLDSHCPGFKDPWLSKFSVDSIGCDFQLSDLSMNINQGPWLMVAKIPAIDMFHCCAVCTASFGGCSPSSSWTGLATLESFQIFGGGLQTLLRYNRTLLYWTPTCFGWIRPSCHLVDLLIFAQSFVLIHLYRPTRSDHVCFVAFLRNGKKVLEEK